jgi:hypothetical protein
MKQLISLFTFCFILMVGNICAPKSETAHICKLMESVEEKIPVGSNTGITEKEFNDVINAFIGVYAPVVKSKGYNLVINRKWSDDTINADTTVTGKNWVINAYGGLARYPSMDPETYLVVMLHELGHHLGGYPAQGWASNEGESDYFATLKGYPTMVNAGYTKRLRSNINVPKSVEEKCSLQHKSQDEINICKKGASIGYTLASILNNLSNGSTPVDFDRSSGPDVTKTNNNHPAAQCRLHTYLNGAVCGMPISEELSADSPIPGACAEEKGDKVGVRNRCWYKPKQ